MVFRARRCVPPGAGVAAAVLYLCAAAAGAQQSAPPIAGIDVWGSDAADAAAALAKLEPEVRRFIAAQAQRRADNGAATSAAAERAIEAKIREAYGVPLAYAKVSLVVNFSPTQVMYVTIDVVEQKDAARRMPFRPAPTERFDDPDGLLAAWHEYEQKVLALLQSGAQLTVAMAKCPALHCVAPFDRPELEPYLARFDDGARKNADALFAIAERSADEEQRATAMFLLAHTNDAERLLPVLGRAIFDPASGVRNNALRVLLFLASTHPELDYPIHDVIAAMDFPAATDRNKAALVTAVLARRPKYRDVIRAEAVPIALRLLRLTQPNHHDPAYQILTAVSGERFGERDYAAWQRWAAERAR
jgi:hypothetical protein